MRSIGSRLDETRGVGPGFDFLRVALAFGVVAVHTGDIARHDGWLLTARFAWFANYFVLDMFFALSGFLIAGSALRLTLANFAINRGLRIVPALAVEIVLSCLILGPLFTALPLHEYFSTPQTYRYFTNIVGIINFHLPGVFPNNPLNVVNESLWTVPFEIGCYVIMAGLITFRLLRYPMLLVLSAALLGVAGTVMVMRGYTQPAPGVVPYVIDQLIYSRGSRLFIFFLLGIAAYLLRHHTPYRWSLFIGALAFCVVLAGVGDRQYPFPPMSLITALPLVYITAFIGVSTIPKLPLFHRGDYSYGIYLYGWPVMQAMLALFPVSGRNPWVLATISVPVITAFAMISWHFIEKPILRLRKKFSFIARQRLEEGSGEAGATALVAPAPSASHQTV